MLISQAAIDLIVDAEVSGQRAYESHYRRPTWPQGQSGLTIGIGYDVGAGVHSAKQLHSDWDGHIPAAMIDAMVPAIGVTGQHAHAITAALHDDVDVPWDAAMAVFMNVDVPRWYATCGHYLQNFEMLSPDCKGAIVSLAYNRGPSFYREGDRFREMRAIVTHMRQKEFSKIPDEFRSMKRLWPNRSERGLPIRREREARLFERGLAATDPLVA